MSGYSDAAKMESNRNCLRRIARHDELQFSKDSIVNVMERFVKTVNVMDETILVPCRLLDRQVGDSTDIVPAAGKNSTANQLMLASNAQGKRHSSNSKNVHEFLSSAELVSIYNMLNSLKNDLLWTGKDEDAEEEYFDNVATGGESSLANTSVNSSSSVSLASKAETSATTNEQQQQQQRSGSKGHIRRPSTASVASTASVSNLSDAESEASNENDSGVESESQKAQSIASTEEQLKKKAAQQDKANELARRCRRHLNGLYQCLEQMTEAANYLTARYQSDIGPV